MGKTQSTAHLCTVCMGTEHKAKKRQTTQACSIVAQLSYEEWGYLPNEPQVEVGTQCGRKEGATQSLASESLRAHNAKIRECSSCPSGYILQYQPCLRYGIHLEGN